MEVENAGIRYSTEDEMRDNVSTQLLNPKGLACLLVCTDQRSALPQQRHQVSEGGGHDSCM